MGRRLLLMLALGALVVGATPASVAAADTIEFDVARARLDAHEAQLLLNLNTDNIVHESVSESWNSLYRKEPGTVTGRFVADTTARSISGHIVETWSCRDCRTSDGQTVWATNQTITITATINDGTLTPQGDEWKIAGSIKIAYKVDIEADENPSDCGGFTCYICDKRICKVNEEMTATATAEGWIEGETLALSYTDRLLADTSQMDFSEIRRTQFIMSRFALQITGTVPPQPEPVAPPEVAAVDPPPADEASQEQVPAQPPDQQEAPGDETVAEQPETARPDSEDEVAALDRAPAPTGSEPDDDGDYAFEIILILILLGFGLVAWTVLKNIEWFAKPKPPDPRIPKPAPPIKPADPSLKTYDLGSSQITYETTVRQVATKDMVTHVLINPQDRSAEITGTDDKGRYHTVQSGHGVVVLRRAGDYAEVQAPGMEPFWVDKYCLQAKSSPPKPQ